MSANDNDFNFSFGRKKEEVKEESKEKKAEFSTERSDQAVKSDAAVSYDRMRRALVLVSSIAIAAALLAILFAINRSVQADQLASQIESQATKVLVPTREIGAGEYITEDDVTEQNVPSSNLPDDAATDAKDIIGRQALVRLSKGAPISLSTLRATKSPNSLSSSIQEGKVAQAISVDASTGLSPLLHVGDEVTVYGTVGDVQTVIADTSRVLALDGALSGGKTDGYATVTLELSPEQSQNLAMATNVRLSLKPQQVEEGK